MSELKKVLAGNPVHYFIQFVPYAPKAVIDSPVAEMITISNCTADEDALRAKFEKCKELSGCNGCATGYSIDEVPGHGRVFVAGLGWDSIEASKNADKSVYVPTDAGNLECHHVNFNFPIKGFGGL
jgi:hypothetical protein